MFRSPERSTGSWNCSSAKKKIIIKSIYIYIKWILKNSTLVRARGAGGNGEDQVLLTSCARKKEPPLRSSPLNHMRHTGNRTGNAFHTRAHLTLHKWRNYIMTTMTKILEPLYPTPDTCLLRNFSGKYIIKKHLFFFTVFFTNIVV